MNASVPSLPGEDWADWAGTHFDRVGILGGKAERCAVRMVHLVHVLIERAVVKKRPSVISIAVAAARRQLSTHRWCMSWWTV